MTSISHSFSNDIPRQNRWAIMNTKTKATSIVRKNPFLKMSAQARTSPCEHILVVYDSHIQMIEQDLEFLKMGLMNNEDVVLVTDAIPIVAILAKIAKE